MSLSKPRAVLTGIGALTPIGIGVEPFWQSLLAGRSGVKPIQAFDTSSLPIRVGGEIPEFDARGFIDKKERKSLKVMARPIQMAVAGATLALDDGNVETARLDSARFGVEFGAGLIASELDEMGIPSQTSANGRAGEIDMGKWGKAGIPSMPPLWMLKYLPNMLACHVSILHNAQGPNNTITQTDAAGLLAIGEAFRILRRGQADIMLTGSADSKMNPLSLTRQSLFGQFSKRSDSPEKACRPFDRRRDGLVFGEGAGIFVMETLEHAQKRGGRIYAEVMGFGSAFDLKRNGEGLTRAIMAALNDAGIRPQQVDHVNAQGFSTVLDDAWEAQGIRKVFGDCRPETPVFAAKSYFGSLGSAGGPVELAASLLALQKGVLPPTLNYEEPDPECPIPVHAGKPREIQRDYVVKISFTEMGQCAVLVVRRWKE